jgi:bacterioferritin (cytochrome b1)
MARAKKVTKSKKLAPQKKGRKSKKAIQEDLIANMRTWRKIENASVASTGRIIEKTENPVVRLVMEIIQRDSQMHYRVQEWISDSLTGKAVTLTPDDIGQVWGMIEDHIKLEQKTVELAKEAIESIGGSKAMQVQAYLLEYLLEDEEKHNNLLGRLAAIQRGMYPYG